MKYHPNILDQSRALQKKRQVCSTAPKEEDTTAACSICSSEDPPPGTRQPGGRGGRHALPGPRPRSMPTMYAAGLRTFVMSWAAASSRAHTASQQAPAAPSLNAQGEGGVQGSNPPRGNGPRREHEPWAPNNAPNTVVSKHSSQAQTTGKENK